MIIETWEAEKRIAQLEALLESSGNGKVIPFKASLLPEKLFVPAVFTNSNPKIGNYKVTEPSFWVAFAAPSGAPGRLDPS